MPDITGIFVSLTVGGGTHDGTDDHVYLGVAGTGGGREFALATARINDFEAGSTVTYSFGPDAQQFGGEEPDTATAELGRISISQAGVTHVYLRKQGSIGHDDDDALDVDSAFVYLVADGSRVTRVFISTGGARLGNESGHVVHLRETGHPA